VVRAQAQKRLVQAWLGVRWSVVQVYAAIHGVLKGTCLGGTVTMVAWRLLPFAPAAVIGGVIGLVVGLARHGEVIDALERVEIEMPVDRLPEARLIPRRTGDLARVAVGAGKVVPVLAQPTPARENVATIWRD
jgi:hypothetical protein